MTFHYSYITKSTFTPAVAWHFFKLRAIPCTNEFQEVRLSQFEVMPSCSLSRSVDGQGNAVQWGAFDYAHESFCVTSAGIVEQTRPYCLHESPKPYYRTETRLTTCNNAMRQQACRCKDVMELMHYVHQHITYTPCHTTTATTAIEVWNDPRGVCQDFAHLMIALCRAKGLHARYVNGLIEGEGQTHAWVEVSDGETWHAYDPTHDISPEWGYIKIAHGRDADDCPTNRGRFYNWTTETQTIITKTSAVNDSERNIT